MSKDIQGIKLDQLQEPLYEAILEYEGISEGHLDFDADMASQLQATPEKSNSARSVSPVKYLGHPIGDMYVIAFKPEDGTGDESAYALEDLVISGNYTRDPKLVPRAKTGVHSEAHMNLLTQRIADPHADPELFKGTYDLVGLKGNLAKRIGILGVDLEASEAAPVATLTVGYRSGGEDLVERFGDPHAVYSSVPDTIQICAFLAIKDEVHKAFPGALRRLHPQLPIGLQ